MEYGTRSKVCKKKQNTPAFISVSYCTLSFYIGQLGQYLHILAIFSPLWCIFKVAQKIRSLHVKVMYHLCSNISDSSLIMLFNHIFYTLYSSHHSIIVANMDMLSLNCIRPTVILLHEQFYDH